MFLTYKTKSRSQLWVILQMQIVFENQISVSNAIIVLNSLDRDQND